MGSHLSATHHSSAEQHAVTFWRQHALLFLYVLLAVVLVSFSSCHRCNRTSKLASGDTIQLSYAQNLTMVSYDDGILVEMKDPWHEGRVLHRYWLTASGKDVPADGTTIVRIPLQHSVVFNTAHASLLGMLNATEKIAGVADLKYMQLPEVHQRVKQGLITDCGNSMSPDVERIVNLQADAILLSPFENSGGYGRLEKIGIPIIECADYMETSPLGRAEWMRFYGLLFGCPQQADSLFSIVEHAYCSLRDSVSTSKPLKILTERLTGSTWYVPGGKSTMARLFADAGGTYAWASDEHSGSLALSFETVLSKSGDADVWVMNSSDQQSLTYERLSAEHHGYNQFKAFRELNIYFVNSLQVPYFEEVSFRPDYLLHDYVMMLHPDLQPSALRYFRKLPTEAEIKQMSPQK